MSLLSSFNNYVAKHYGRDTGKMLIHTGVVGWILSSAAQVAAILLNDKIPKEQKMYMVPQEMADAAVNIISFYAVTQTFKAISSKLVTSGKWLPKSLKSWLTAKNFGDKLGKMDFNIFKDANLSYAAKKRANLFKEGVDVISTTVGSILSCNIITPIVRNEIAANRQKSSLAKIKNQQEVAPALNPVNTNYINKPTLQAFQSRAYSLKV